MSPSHTCNLSPGLQSGPWSHQPRLRPSEKPSRSGLTLPNPSFLFMGLVLGKDGKEGSTACESHGIEDEATEAWNWTC